MYSLAKLVDKNSMQASDFSKPRAPITWLPLCSRGAARVGICHAKSEANVRKITYIFFLV